MKKHTNKSSGTRIPLSLVCAINECRGYMERGTKIPDNGRLGFPVTTYTEENVKRIPIDVYFEADGWPDKTQFDLFPEVFDKAVAQNSSAMFWEIFTKELAGAWNVFCGTLRIDPECVREVDICY